MWTRFWCWPALHLSKTKSTPMGACFWFSTPPPTSPSLSHLPNTKNTPHGVCFSCLACSEHENREHVRVFRVLWLACPSLQPPPSTGDARHAYVSPLPSPTCQTRKTGPCGVFFVFGTAPPAEHEKRATLGAFFVFSTRAAPLTPSAFPLVPDTAHPLHPPSRRTRKTPRWVCFPCSAHPFFLRRTQRTHPCGCVLCVRRALFLRPRVEHGQHTHVSVLFVFGAPFASPLASNTENSPTLVCSLCSVLPLQPPSHRTQKTHPCGCVLWCSVPLCLPSSLLVTTLLGKFLFR